MGSWKVLCQELAECERQLVAVKLKAEEKKEIEYKRLDQVLAKEQEMLDAHEREVQAQRAEFEKAVQGVVSRAEEDVDGIETMMQAADERRKLADSKAEALELQAKELERQIRATNGHLDQAEEVGAQKYEALLQRADDTVREKESHTNLAVRDAALYASEVQDGTMCMMASMQEELQSKITQATAKSQERSRFVQLHHVALEGSKEDQYVSRTELSGRKSKLMQEWLQDWVGQTHSSAPVSTLQLEAAPEALKPSSPDLARSVDRARRKAMELQRSGCGIVGEHRPKTAP